MAKQSDVCFSWAVAQAVTQKPVISDQFFRGLNDTQRVRLRKRMIAAGLLVFPFATPDGCVFIRKDADPQRLNVVRQDGFVAGTWVDPGAGVMILGSANFPDTIGKM